MSAISLKPTIHNTYGAAFIGAIFAAVLYGLTTLQTYLYFTYYSKDDIKNKILVSIIWIFDSIQIALVSLCMYHYLVTNYANPPALATVHWSLLLSVGTNVTIEFCVQCFFTFQIFRLSNRKIRWWLTSVIAVFVVAHFCFGIETVILFFVKKEFSELQDIKLFTALPSAMFSVLSDIFIAGALCILLHGSRTGFKKTNTLITTLIVYAINRCLLTLVIAVAEVIVFSVAKHDLWYLAIEFVMGKLYANCLLATLNSRRALQYNTFSTTNSFPLSGIEFGSGERRRDDTHGIGLSYGSSCGDKPQHQQNTENS